MMRTNNIKHIFFDQDINLESNSLSEEESIHCIKTLRLKPKDNIHITNGKGYLFEAIITDISKKIVSIEVIQAYNKAKIHKRFLHLAVSPLKNKDRIDFIIEKAVEVGVGAISIINCSRTINKTIKIERLNKIAISAIKQSQQYYLPQVYGPIDIIEFINSCDTKKEQLLMAHCLDTANKRLINKIKLEDRVTLMIGPEGDFTPSEISYALEYKSASEISLGVSRLRTETAAIVASFSILNTY